MRHLGDITKINGAEIGAVDVITGGSPCQDLSIAGKLQRSLQQRVCSGFTPDSLFTTLSVESEK